MVNGLPRPATFLPNTSKSAEPGERSEHEPCYQPDHVTFPISDCVLLSVEGHESTMRDRAGNGLEGLKAQWAFTCCGVTNGCRTTLGVKDKA